MGLLLAGTGAAGDPEPGPRRLKQPDELRPWFQRIAIYAELRAVDEELVVVLGDLNDTPDSTPLRPLVGWTELRDVSTHQSFDPASFPGLEDKTGTYDLGNPNQKIDCLLMSPALFGRIDSCGLFRKGAWPGSCPPRWEVYPELQEKIHVASDHHVIWAEID